MSAAFSPDSRGRKAGTQHRPLTFLDVARHIARNPSPCLVQVRIKHTVLCGRVVEVGSPTAPREFFKVHTALGEQWVTAWNARLCSGDGRCTCEAGKAAPEAAEPARAQRGLPPYSNTGVTLVVGA